ASSPYAAQRLLIRAPPNRRIISRMRTQLVLWDFEGTLAHRPNGMWGASLRRALDEVQPGHHVTAESLSPKLATGFPWHEHETPHPHLSEAEAWWSSMESLLADALIACGVEREVACHAVKIVTRTNPEPSSWSFVPRRHP